MAAVGLLRLLFLLAVCWSCLAGAAEPIPPLAARVTDRTGTLSGEQLASLEQTLAALEASKGIQIGVLMVPTTGVEPIEQYALRAAEQWQLGRKGVDDGVLLVVAKNDRNLRIEVGYGLEGALTDATSKRIVSEIMVPRFQQGDFYGGIADGIGRIVRVVEGEPLPPPRAASRPAADGGGGFLDNLPGLLVLALVVGGFMRAILGRLLGAAATGGITGFLAWWLLGAFSLALVAGGVAFLFTLLSGAGMGRRGGWPGGGWGGGSGGFGGGFRGGGGGFGGGGASGRW